MYYVRGGSQIDLTSISYFRLLQYDDNSEKIETQSEEVPVHVRKVVTVTGLVVIHLIMQSMIKLKEWRSIHQIFSVETKQEPRIKAEGRC